MPRNKDIKKVLVIGSGPIVIGQAAEFDYAGTQACRSLKEEGVEVVLVNSNPATIMTDKEIADEVYIEPLTVDVLEKIIAKVSKSRAKNGTRTRDPNLGKVVLYQLSYFRNCECKDSFTFRFMQMVY